MVGETAIGAKDILYKIGIEKAYGSRTVNTAAGAVSLANDAIEMEVARVADVRATPEETAALGKHADENSKAPATLARIKAVFGSDIESYERLYLAPKIINRKLRACYARGAETHGRQRSAINEARWLVRSGKSLKEAAEECDLRFLTFEYGNGDEDAPAELLWYFPEAGKQKEPLAEILDGLSPGEVYETTLASGEVVGVDPGHIALFEPSVDFSITRVKGVRNMLLGGEGLFLAKLTGPGKVWLQSLPLPNLAAKLNRYIAKK